MLRVCFIVGAFLLVFFNSHVLLAIPSTPAKVDSPGYERLFTNGVRVFIEKETFYFILVEKDKQRLAVLEYNGNPKVAAEFPCATGENFGRKEQSGDEKTPEGVYFITKIYTDNKITIFGNRALHLDYPNVFDVAAGRNGNGIYIHGTNKKLRPNSTNGCITLRNSDLEQLVKFLKKDVTPVVIVPNVDVFNRENIRSIDIPPSQAEELLLPEMVDREQVEFDYLYCIHDGFQTVVLGEFAGRHNRQASLRWRMRSYLEPDHAGRWASRKRVLRTPVGVGPLVFKEMTVAAVQPVKEWQRPTEQQERTVPAVQVASAKRIGLQGVVAVSSEAVRKKQPEPKKTLAVAVPPSKKRGEKAEEFLYPKDVLQVKEFLETWRQAWQSKEIDTYISCYAKSFKKDGKDIAAWRSHKERLNRNYKTIQVDISDVKVSWSKVGAVISFRQVYRSERYFARGRKILHLVYKDSDWKITRELWHSD